MAIEGHWRWLSSSKTSKNIIEQFQIWAFTSSQNKENHQEVKPMNIINKSEYKQFLYKFNVTLFEEG